MTLQIRAYSSTKHVGLPWLGAIPERWEMRRAKQVLHPIDVRSRTGDEELLTVSSEHGIIPRSEASVAMFEAESYVGHKLCWPDDLVINSLWAWARGLGVSSRYGIVSTAYGVYRPRSDSQIAPRFLHYLVRSASFQWELQVRSKGIWKSRLQLTDTAFLDAPLPVPPLAEQAAIVRYLDHIERRISRYIRAKQRLIELLEEQKQAIVHQAVTRGLDPNVPLTPSGVEWLGDVPEHWGVVKIKQLASDGYRSFVDGDWIESPYITTEGIRLIQTGNIGVGQYREQGFRFINEETFNNFNCTEFQPGDVLICRLGEPVARACLAPHLGTRMITSVDVCILKPRRDVDAQFVIYAMSSRRYLEWVGSLVRGSTRDRVSRSMLGSFSIPLPPPLEQAAIVRYLNGEAAKVDAATNRAEREIELLREYRTRLIADVVTGKLDVRAAAAELTEGGAADLGGAAAAQLTPELGEVAS